MTKWICALMAAALILSCAALAEPEASATPAPTASTAEILSIEAVPVSTPTPQPEASPSAGAGEATPAADAQRIQGVLLRFEDGFSLELPEGWLYHNLSEEMAEAGVLYCLSDAEGAAWLYIQSWTTDCADMNALSALIERSTKPKTSGVYPFNGTDFVVYDLTGGDVSCCAALLDGRILNFVFTPQSDADYMATAAQIMNTFTVLNA